MKVYAAGLLLTLVLVGCGDESRTRKAPPPPQVTVASPLVRGIVEWDRYTGRLEALETVEIRSRVSGFLRSIHFDEGHLVNEGDLLAVVDPRPFEADLTGAKASLEEARAGLIRSDALLAQAKAEQSQALSAKTLAETRLANAKRALATNAIAKEQVDVRESEFLQAEAAVSASEAAIASADADIATSNAAIHTAEASVARAELELSYTEIRAPISGRISSRLVTKGNLVQGGSAGATLITTLLSVDPIHITFDANEQAFLKYVRLSKSGARPSSRDYKNPIYVALVDEEGYPHRGHMDFVDNRMDPNTGTMRARGILRNPNGDIFTPGLFATVRLPGSARYDAVLVPDEAISANQSERYVFLVDQSNTVRVAPVTLGPMVDGLRVIRSGLDGSERMVIRGLQRVRPGAVVQAVAGTVEVSDMDDGLPNDFKPLSKDEWITAKPDRLPRESGEGNK